MEELARRVDLDRQPSLGEVDLDRVRSLVEARPDLALVLGKQVVDEPFARIAADLLLRVHQAERGR